MSRASSDEHYVVDLCDHVLCRAAQRQYRFDFLRGDPNPIGKRVLLPVDAYWPDLRLVVEYRERQHFESVAIMNRRTTISGVLRGEQRRRYDQRRHTVLPANGYNLVVLRADQFDVTDRKRLRRRREADIEVIRHALRPFLGGPPSAFLSNRNQS